MLHITPYLIKRSHSNNFGFFIVNVTSRYYRERGIGVQIRVPGGRVMGISVTFSKKDF